MSDAESQRSSGEPESGSRGRPRLRIGLWILLGLALVVVFELFQAPGGVEVSYTRFREELEAGNVAEVTLEGHRLGGSFEEPVELGGGSVERFVTHVPAFEDQRLLERLEEEGVEVRVEPAEGVSWGGILLSLAPFLLLIGIGWMLYRQMQVQGGRMTQLTRNPAKPYDRSREGTGFDDVAGNEGAKRELTEIIAYLESPERFRKVGAEVPRGVLLKGPPGTGKTLMARAVAGEAEVPFFSITGSDFMEMLVGVGASRVRDMFQQAKKEAPAILFIDELDSIGRRRGTGLGGGHDEREQTLNQLLSEMDGFEGNENVIVMAATNRPDILDPALLRPGRFDRTVTTELPPRRARLEILRLHGAGKPLADAVDLEKLARSTPGFSGADLENLLNEAALLAARQGREEILPDDVEEARDKVMMGLRRESLDLSDEELRTLAYHESGHALLAALLPHADPLHKVSIIPRGRAMGVTQQLPEKRLYLYPREYLLDRLVVMMGGRAAEELVLETITSGAENDLQAATRIARRMVLSWGMSEGLGHQALGGGEEEVFLGQELARRREYSEETARRVDEEVSSILEECYERATEMLSAERERLERLATALLDEEEIAGERIQEILELGDEQESG